MLKICDWCGRDDLFVDVEICVQCINRFCRDCSLDPEFEICPDCTKEDIDKEGLIMSERLITDHVVERDSAPQLTIAVLDSPGQGGANHEYCISWQTHESNILPIRFQNGPIREFGINGITQEALLAIVIDRLRSFQAGPFSCRDNAIALTHCEEALMWLQRRTRERIKRGVEGTNQK